MTVGGLAPLVGALREAEGRVRVLTPALTETARHVQAAADPRTPRKTGALRASLSASVSSGRLRFTSSAAYFVPVHFGRRRRGIVAARPYLTDAIATTTDTTLAALTTHITAPLERL